MIRCYDSKAPSLSALPGPGHASRATSYSWSGPRTAFRMCREYSVTWFKYVQRLGGLDESRVEIRN